MSKNDADEVEELPEIKKIEYPTRVSPEEHPAVIIWFDNQTALRYVWLEEAGEIEEQAYVDGCVHSAFKVGGEREELAEYALLSVSEYVNELREDPEACGFDWGHIYEMLVR